jgi:hypothetical protein
MPMSGTQCEDALVVDSDEFERIRADICASGSASDGDNLLGMEMDASFFLDSPLNAAGDLVPWKDMTVQRSEGAEWLIRGEASGLASDAQAIGDYLSRMWEEHLRYGFRSAHTITSGTDCVHMHAVTLSGPGGIWVTAEVRVALS